MLRPRKIPKLRKHVKGSSVVLDGKHYYCGPYGSAEAQEKYERLVGEWLLRPGPVSSASSALAAPVVAPVSPSSKAVPAPSPLLLPALQPLAPTLPAPELLVKELVLLYWDHVKAYYVKDEAPTSEQNTIQQALRPLLALYGELPAHAFGPKALKQVRDAMIDPSTLPQRLPTRLADAPGRAKKKKKPVPPRPLCRSYINKQIGRIKRMFRWAVENELVPSTSYHALQAVTGLQRDRSRAREKDPVRPVSDADVTAILPFLPPLVAVMVQLQRLSGARPQDIVQLRACDLDQSSAVWEYRPRRYKTQHHGTSVRERVVVFGPQAQALLKPLLTGDPTKPVFSPQKAEADRNAARRKQRCTPRWPSHVQRQAALRLQRPARQLRPNYSVDSYRRAIHRACDKASIPRWCPLQLRHTAATAIRKAFGLEAAQAVLGHAELGVTQVYAEVDRTKAREVMAHLG